MTFRLFWIVSVIFLFVFMIRELGVIRGGRTLKYFFTPLITISVICIPLIAVDEAGLTLYNSLILVSLLFALAADTLLMVDEADLLRHGMVFFLCGHILYAGAFSIDYVFKPWNFVLLICIAAAGVFHVKRISRTAGKMKLPVAVYAMAISVMIFFAVTRLNNGITTGASMAAAGAVLFGISDYIHSKNTYLQSIENSTVFTWLFYAPAQFLIAASTLSVF